MFVYLPGRNAGRAAGRSKVHCESVPLGGALRSARYGSGIPRDGKAIHFAV